MTTNQIDELSDRELEILRLLATGVSNKEIANQLFISPNTVKVHLRNIFSKIGVNSRTEAAMYAVTAGIVTGGPLSDVPEGQIEGEASEVSKVSSLLVQKKWLWGLVSLFVLFLLVAIGMAVYLVNGLEDNNNSFAPITASQGWQVLREMPTARYNLAAAAYENQIYAIGGSDKLGITGLVERYHPETDRWEPGAPKLTAVDQIQAAVLGGLIYIPGGRLASGEVTDRLEIYDPRQDTWMSGKAVPVAVSAYALAAFEGRLYLFGGWNGDRYLVNVFSYDPESDQWRVEPDMPTARAFLGAGVAGRKIYVVGGFDGEQALAVSEVFIPDLVGSSSDPWSPANPLPESLYGMGTASVADMIYVVGGKSDAERQYASLVYFDQSGEWQAFDGPQDGPEDGLALTTLGVNLYALGGRKDNVPINKNLNYQVMYTVSFPIIVK